MSKKKQLTEAEIFYIQQKSVDGMTPDEISSVLKVSLDEIVQYIQKPKTESRTLQSFVRKSAGGRDGVVVATKNSSEYGDIKPEKSTVHSDHIAPTH